MRPNQIVTFRHPANGRNFTIPLTLPQGTPRLRSQETDRIVYNYGGYIVEVRSSRTGPWTSSTTAAFCESSLWSRMPWLRRVSQIVFWNGRPPFDRPIFHANLSLDLAAAACFRESPMNCPRCAKAMAAAGTTAASEPALFHCTHCDLHFETQPDDGIAVIGEPVGKTCRSAARLCCRHRSRRNGRPLRSMRRVHGGDGIVPGGR